MYTYNAIVTKVYDGDTVTVDFDLGLGIWLKKQSIRLHGINAPEMRGPDKIKGKESRDWLREAILDKEVVIKTHKDKKGKYGRWVGEIWLPEHFLMSTASINRQLVSEGLAVEKEY